MKDFWIIVKSIYFLVNHKRRLHFLVILNFFSGFAEMLSIGAIIPFISVLANPNILEKNIFFITTVDFLGIHKWVSNPGNIIVFFSIVFFLAILIATFFKLYLMRYNHRLMYDISAYFNNKLYSNILNLPYEEHLKLNSGNVISQLTHKMTLLTGALNSLVLMVSSLVSTFFIVILLLSYQAQIILGFSFFLAIVYFFLSKIFRIKLTKNSEVIAVEQSRQIRIVQDGLGAIRDVILANNHNFYTSLFYTSTRKLNATLASNYFIGHSPKVILEFLAMLFIGAMSIGYQSSTGGLLAALPIMGVLALSAQRILPSIQAAYQNWSSIQSSKESLMDLFRILKRSNENIILKSDNSEEIKFHKEISLKNVTFKFYDKPYYILRNVSLKIRKGSYVAFVGETGSGKSTTIDLIMGLLKPCEGSVLIDDSPLSEKNICKWQSLISHVPQNIFITDGSIAENVAFGIDPNLIDEEQVMSALKKAGLGDFIDSLPNKIFSEVGERGTKLSGGQRQRLGIARALYTKGDVLIIDEATSALDTETERKVLQTINQLSNDLTIITIAHRHTALKNCDKIYFLKDQSVTEFNGYQDFVESTKL